MGWTDLWLRVRALARRRGAECELDEELNFHLEMEARKNRLAGMSEAQARRAARVEFGGVERAREECRDARGVAFLQNLARDLRYGWRVLLKTPLFTAIAILSLAIGIGANTAIFSLVDTVLLRMLPVRSPEQLVILKWAANQQPGALYYYATSNRRDGQGRFQLNVFSWDIFAEVRSHSRTVSDAFGFSHLGQLNVTANGEPRVAGGLLVSGNYFSGLGVNALLGRLIAGDDDTVDGVPAAVVSYRFWERAFGLDRAAIGKTIYINHQPAVVVGVTPREFFGVSAGGFVATPEVDVTLPIRVRDRFDWGSRTPIPFFAPDRFWIQMMGRVKPASDERAVRAELTAILNANMPEAALGDRVHRDQVDVDELVLREADERRELGVAGARAGAPEPHRDQRVLLHLRAVLPDHDRQGPARPGHARAPASRPPDGRGQRSDGPGAGRRIGRQPCGRPRSSYPRSGKPPPGTGRRAAPGTEPPGGSRVCRRSCRRPC